MRFLLLLYGDEAAEAALSQEERMSIVGQHTEFHRGLKERGVLVASEPLEPSSSARTMRRHDRTVTDGPFMEAREQLGGFYLVECADMDAAAELASGLPDSPGLVVEIRPVPEF